MATFGKCKCGKAIVGKYQSDRGMCKACSAKRTAELYEQAAAIVATGKCPTCGTALERNLALTGWWQCGAYGEPSFRKPEHRTLPYCSFQTFMR